jgi:hypothetical protein
MDKSEIEFETHDIYLAAYLNLAGCKLERKRKEGRRVFFVFTNPAGSIQELRDAYYSGTATVPAFKYAQGIIGMKQMCFDIDSL